MPLDAQDRLAVEKLEELFRRVSRTAPRMKSRLEFVSAAKVLALTILEMCPPSELREEIFAQLRGIAGMVGAAMVEEETPITPAAD